MKNNLAITHPELAKQWSDKNEFGPESVSHGSNKIAWRKPPCGHEYEQMIKSWPRSECSVCAGRIVIPGINDFASAAPELAKQWSDKNTFGPDSLAPHSQKKAWRTHPCGHETQQKVASWAISGCIVCRGVTVIEGENNLATTHPELAKQWSDKNDFGPESVSHGSNKMAWRKMDCGHEFEQMINTWKTRSCLVCSKAKTFDITHPELAKQWSDKNTFAPSEVTHGSRRKAWRKPLCGHEFEQGIAEWKINECSVCTGGVVVKGVNDFKSVYPEYVKEWSKNNLFYPDSITYGSGKKAWRKPPCGHEFEQIIGNWSKHGCPKCANHVSKSEQEIFDFIKTLCPDAQQSNRTLIAPKEVDIYIPSKNIAIEFNGLYWHSEAFRDKNYHHDKWLACKNQGVQLITIWEDQWVNNRAVVEKMLKAKLVGGPAIGGRNTETAFISYRQASDFLNSWHIQGSCAGSFYIGLFRNDILIGVSVISKNGELRRYASSISIIGGLDKCLKFSGLTEFYTFADHCVSAGGLYESTGWIEEKTIKPDYKYYSKTTSILEHKFNYRIKRFKTDNNLSYDPNKSERQLALDNGLHRVYDCGKTKYVRKFN